MVFHSPYENQEDVVQADHYLVDQCDWYYYWVHDKTEAAYLVVQFSHQV